MAAINTVRSSAPISVPSFSSQNFFKRVFVAFTERLAAERTYRELSRLSHAQLRDIGLEEHDLMEVSRELARGVR